MINKIKDFLKSKMGQKSSDTTSNEGEIDLSTPPDQVSREDRTGEFKIPSELHRKDKFVGLKEKFSNFNFNFLKKGSKTDSDSTSGTQLLSPSLNQWIEKLLSRSYREPIHQFSLALIICFITYSIGKITALVLRGAPAVHTAKEYTVTVPLEKDFNTGTLSQVKRINIFRTNVGPAGKKKVADVKCEEAQQASSLPIKLINTVVLQDSVKSLASVQVRGNRELSEVRVGDEIDNLAKIFKITRLELLVKNLESGACESISSDKMRETRSRISIMSPSASKEFRASKKMAGIENLGNKFSISKTLLDDKLKDIGAVLTQVKAIKIQNPDGTLAFKLTEMDPEGIFPYLGLQDQDIITSINGKPIYDLNEVMGMFARIKNLDNLQLGVKREGSDSLQEYSIKK